MLQLDNKSNRMCHKWQTLIQVHAVHAETVNLVSTRAREGRSEGRDGFSESLLLRRSSDFMQQVSCQYSNA